MRYVFNRISIKGTRRWKDADGRRHQETREFWQSINPFNVGKDGFPKSESEIRDEIETERAAWLKGRAP